MVGIRRLATVLHSPLRLVVLQREVTHIFLSSFFICRASGLYNMKLKYIYKYIEEREKERKKSIQDARGQEQQERRQNVQRQQLDI